MKEFTVRFSGLNLGKHSFEFEVTDSFFESFDNSEVEHAALHVTLQLDKKVNMLELEFKVSGTINLPCDRCTDLFDLVVEGRHRLIVKFGDEPIEQTDDIIVLAPEAFEIAVAEHIFEMIALSIPLRRVHPEDSCDKEMLKSIERFSVNDEKKSEDPRWDALKGLK